MAAKLPRAGAKVHELLNAGFVADQEQNAARLKPHVRRRGRDQLAADPLADDRDAGVLAEVGLGQRFAAEHAVARDTRFADGEFVTEVLDAGDRRTDFLTGARSERGAENVARRVRRGGAGEHDRLAMKRVFDQREDFAPIAELACRENDRRVALVGAIGDQRARLVQAGLLQDPLVEFAVDDAMALLGQSPCVGGVLLDHDGGDAGPFQLAEQGRHRRTVVKDDDVIFEARRLSGQARLEPLFEKRDQVKGKNQKKQKHADELNEHDVGYHERVIPAGILAVAGGGQRLSRPFQSLPKSARLSFEVSHAPHV